MKVLMLGWEFPPFFAGGVGIVCYELTKALSHIKDLEITYVMPFGPKDFSGSEKTKHVNLIIANNMFKDLDLNIRIETIDTIFQAYMSPEEYLHAYEESIANGEEGGEANLYGKNLYLEVERYAQKVRELVKGQHFDVIHAHDWMTIPAGMAAKEVLGCPLVVHAHNTVFDRYLGGSCSHERAIEEAGYRNADLVISISQKIKDTLMNEYQVNPDKIKIVYNGGITDLKKSFEHYDICSKDDKFVLYAGRAVLQKGPEYFVRAAAKVIEHEPNAKFILAGAGHLLPKCIELAAELGIGKNIYFHGFYTRDDAERFFSMADVFIMPSLSEPFGLVPLEALAKGTPTIISKQSGISECLHNCFKVDFWDVDEMANKTIALLRYEPLHNHMRSNGYEEVDNFDWNDRAHQIVGVYSEAIANKNRQ